MDREKICTICESPNQPFGSGLVLKNYNVQFFRCPRCGFIQSETPYWLDEAYASPIASSDIGYVTRNVALARVTRALIALGFNSNAHFVDYGGGYGMFVRLLRDAGFNFWRYDRHCENLFAQGFDIAPESGESRFELVTAFEVFEHLVDPRNEIEQMLNLSPTVLFSTVILPEPPPPIGSWWYYVLAHGQHISFYTVRSLEVLAERYNLHLRTNRGSLHLLSRAKISALAFRAATRPPLPRIVNLLFRRKSLLSKDAAQLASL